MTQLTWDNIGEREYETGVDHGVLYIPTDGVYDDGVAWNGLTTVTESPSGAESNKQYADNQVYVNLISAEQFDGTIEAFTYPKEFEQFDGKATPTPGVTVGQQDRGVFGLSYRTLKGNDQEGTAYGYKLHLVYDCQAAPSEQAHATVNDSPEALNFSWTISTTPVPVTGHKPTSTLTIDSTEVDGTLLSQLEDLLYGTSSTSPQLPTPDQVIALFEGTSTNVNLNTAANQPTYDSGTHVVTLPAVTGVQWKVNGVNKASGAQPALTAGQTAVVEAVAQSGYILEGDTDWAFDY